MTSALPDERPAVLVIEDEPAFADALETGLTREGFDVVVASDGVAGLESFDRSRPDVVLLDLMLPRLSGTEVCRALRSRSDCPIIVVTARSEEIDAVLTLELGADDYVTKPFRLRELAARIRAVLRRAGARGADRVDLADHEIRHSGVVVNRETREVTVDGSPADLTRMEFNLLEALMTTAGRVQTRQHLIDEVWGADYFGDTKTLDVHVKRLRSKLGDPTLISTFRGVGYRFEVRNRPESRDARGSATRTTDT